MHAALAAALAPVLTDLRTCSVPEPDIRDEPWTDERDLATAMLHAPDGAGCGVRVTLGSSRAAQVAEVADLVQEWVIEQLWRSGTNWPRCPRHPTTHPMQAEVVADVAVWRCPVDHAATIPIGDLPAPG